MTEKKIDNLYDQFCIDMRTDGFIASKRFIFGYAYLLSQKDFKEDILSLQSRISELENLLNRSVFYIQNGVDCNDLSDTSYDPTNIIEDSVKILKN